MLVIFAINSFTSPAQIIPSDLFHHGEQIVEFQNLLKQLEIDKQDLKTTRYEIIPVKKTIEDKKEKENGPMRMVLLFTFRGIQNIQNYS